MVLRQVRTYYPFVRPHFGSIDERRVAFVRTLNANIGLLKKSQTRETDFLDISWSLLGFPSILHFSFRTDLLPIVSPYLK